MQCGENAVTVAFENTISEAVNRQVAALCAKMEEKQIPGVTDLIPAFCALTVCYDCTVLSAQRLTSKIRRLLSDIRWGDGHKKRIFVVPVCYDAAFGMDMETVCQHSALSREQVIALHSGTDYLIYMLGFLPGFAYLGGLDARLETPRLANPRTVIPAGSVGIGGAQTGIYPVDSPGGWQLIGRTPVRVFDLAKEDPILYRAGDYIRFRPISADTYASISADVEAQRYQAEILEESI